MSKPSNDQLMEVMKLAATYEPQKLIWLAMHTCYSPTPDTICNLSEYKAGNAVVQHLLQGGKGHWSPLEQAHISLHMKYVPHSVMQQLRTHRILSFSVQSFRYTSEQFELYTGDPEQLARLVYLREPGEYVGRNGERYTYTKEELLEDMFNAHHAILRYQGKIKLGHAPDHARGQLPFDLRQHMVVGGNLRAWLHLLDLRLKADAQSEIQQLAHAVLDELICWCPQIVHWYKLNRAGKAMLSP
jgi:thymidylate synthase (FAD)